MLDFIASVVFSAAFGASVWTIYTSIRDQWDRILEVLAYSDI